MQVELIQFSCARGQYFQSFTISNWERRSRTIVFIEILKFLILIGYIIASSTIKVQFVTLIGGGYESIVIFSLVIFSIMIWTCVWLIIAIRTIHCYVSDLVTYLTYWFRSTSSSTSSKVRVPPVTLCPWFVASEINFGFC